MTDSSPPSQAQEASARKRNRTIQNLNEEQLRNKRLVDRKAQRAFRQRSKDCMTNLAALQEVCRQKDREIEELRDRNTRLHSHLQTICQSVSVAARLLEEENASEQGTVYEPMDTNDAPREPPDDNITAQAERCSSEAPSTPTSEPANDVSSPARVSGAAAQSTMDEPGLNSSYSPTAAGFRATDGRLHPITEPMERRSPVYGHSHATASNPPVAGGYDELSPEDAGSRMSFSTNAAVSNMQGPLSTRDMVSAVLPAHSMPTCPLDHILADFRQSRCDELSQGFPLDRVVGPQTAVVSALFDHEHATNGPPLSVMLAEVLSTFPHPKRTEKLAFFYLMYQTMRWLVFPAKESYDSMPTWLRPTVTQITVSHPPWIDNIPWPEVRDMLIEEPEEYPFESFSENYSEHVRVNWPFESHDAVSAVDGNFVLHSIFLKHIQNINHWTVAPQFLERYPRMAQAIKVHQKL